MVPIGFELLTDFGGLFIEQVPVFRPIQAQAEGMPIQTHYLLLMRQRPCSSTEHLRNLLERPVHRRSLSSISELMAATGPPDEDNSLSAAISQVVSTFFQGDDAPSPSVVGRSRLPIAAEMESSPGWIVRDLRKGGSCCETRQWRWHARPRSASSSGSSGSRIRPGDLSDAFPVATAPVRPTNSFRADLAEAADAVRVAQKEESPKSWRSSELIHHVNLYRRLRRRMGQSRDPPEAGADDRFGAAREIYRELKVVLRNQAARMIQRFYRVHGRVYRWLGDDEEESRPVGSSATTGGARSGASASNIPRVFVGAFNVPGLSHLPKVDEVPVLDSDAVARTKSILKRHLRDLDRAFEEDKGQKPSRSDKETLRPLYEIYRALKREMSRRGLSTGAEDDQDERGGLPVRTVRSDRVMEPPVAAQREERAREERGQRRSTEGRATEGTDDRDRPPTEMKDVETILRGRDLAALQREKRRLQVRLRAYEARFRAEKGRSVRYRRDITPVQDEYERYKALKKRIQQLDR